MFKIILVVVAVLGAGVLLYATTRPDSFRVERSITVRASPEKIFPLINDLHRFVEWSPYEDKDPGMKRWHSGAKFGPGAKYGWEGNAEIGEGNLQITASTQPSTIIMALDQMRPIEAHNIVEFTLLPSGDTTQVNWAVHGPSPLISKLLGVFIDMDRMIGRDFEDGLARLKLLAESAPPSAN